MHPARSGDRNVVGGDRHLPDRGIGFLRRGDRYTMDRWNVSGGVVTPPPFDPTTITGMTLWLKADAITGLSDGTPLTAGWNDSSGLNHNFVPMFGSPTYKTNIVNGLPVCRFNGVNQAFQNNSHTIVGSGNYTVIVVASAASVSARQAAIFGSGVNFSTVQINRNIADLNDQVNSGGYVYCSEPGGIVAGAWNVITVDWAGSNIHLWRNGALKNTTGATLSSSPGLLTTIGNNVESNLLWDGDIAEVLVYNSSLSSTDRHNVESYLSAKYGITVTPGFRDILLERVKDRMEKQQ